MATSKSLDKSKLNSLPKKKDVIKTPPVDDERAVKGIHGEKGNGYAPPPEREATTNISLATPISLSKALKRKIIDTEENQTEYILRLIKEDLGLISKRQV